MMISREGSLRGSRSLLCQVLLRLWILRATSSLQCRHLLPTPLLRLQVMVNTRRASHRKLRKPRTLHELCQSHQCLQLPSRKYS
ncbi:hypothetical protein PF010_g14099 [Phytophthora fragariae]|uniref:Secreted protein n=1 Tax=Phytophthora fragariae TaxID=53985 RepID=A0A6G0NFM5_9STRA|nr:hypothetical protein PF010_g14099 [Phytophthora fragariae]KAE9206195.1 hypothetical protein PF004_g17368 [Phytophthora fragariae]